jgi:3-oxoacyl-[acyl-carrier-protein] synthase II
MLYAAATQAIKDSGNKFEAQDEDAALRSGCFIATNFANHLYLGRLFKQGGILDDAGNHQPRDVIAHLVPNLLPERIINDFRLHGCTAVLAQACSGGLMAILSAADAIAHGHCDVALAGGVEGFQDSRFFNEALQRLGGYADPPSDADPNKVMNCFGVNRSGTLAGDGCGLLVLEEKQRAIERGARIYAELAGGAHLTSGHWTSLHKDHLLRLLDLTLKDAALPRDAISAVSPHATSTIKGDNVELSALREFFGTGAHRVSVSPTKDVTGHAWAASGIARTRPTVSC